MRADVKEVIRRGLRDDTFYGQFVSGADAIGNPSAAEAETTRDEIGGSVAVVANLILGGRRRAVTQAVGRHRDTQFRELPAARHVDDFVAVLGERLGYQGLGERVDPEP